MEQRRRPGEVMIWLGASFSLLLYGFLFLPMLVLIIMSFNIADSGAEWLGFTFNWYLKLLDNESILESLYNSFFIAFFATWISGFLGLALGMSMSRSHIKGKSLLKKIANLPIVFPDIVIALALLAFFDFIRLPLGKFSVVIAHASFGAAYVAAQVRSRLHAMDALLEEAASDLGASELKTFMQITLPQLKPALISGMLMVFTLSFDDFIIAFFTAGVDATTLPMKIYSMLKFGVIPEVNALSSLILMGSVLFVSLAYLTGKSSRQTL